MELLCLVTLIVTSATWLVWPALGLWVGMQRRRPLAGVLLPLIGGPFGLAMVVMTHPAGRTCPECGTSCPKGVPRCAACGARFLDADGEPGHAAGVEPGPAFITRPQRTKGAECPACHRSTLVDGVCKWCGHGKH